MKKCIQSLEHIKCCFWVNIGLYTLLDHTSFFSSLSLVKMSFIVTSTQTQRSKTDK